MPKREETTHAKLKMPALRWLLLVVVAVLPYLSLPSKPLVADANRAIVLNQTVQQEPLAKLFAVDFWGHPTRSRISSRSYRPFTSLTWAAQSRLSGNEPTGLHLIDMLIHVGMTLLVALFLKELIAVPAAVFWSAAIYAVHPLLSEAVASVVGRADMLAAAAGLGALVLHLRAPRAKVPWRFEAGALACLAVALLSKEYAVTFPFLLVVVAWSLQSVTDPGQSTRTRRNALWAAALALLGGYLVLRWGLFGSLGGVPMVDTSAHPLVSAPLATRWANAAWLLLFALGKSFVPTGLNFYYHGYGTVPLAGGVLDPRALAAVVLFGVLGAAALWALRSKKRPEPLIALALFVLPLAPALNTVSISAVLFAERFMYLPLVGPVLMLAWLSSRWLASRSAMTAAAQLALAALVAVGIYATHQRVAQYESEETLARATLETYPQSSMGWFQIALAHGRRAEHQLAAQAFDNALKSSTDDPRLWKNYGVSLLQLGRFDEAAGAYRTAIENSPQDLPPLWRGLGTADLRAGRFEQAVASLQRAFELDRSDEGTSAAYAQALLRAAQQRLEAGDSAQAGEYARQALELSGLPGEAFFLAGMVLVRAGEPQPAAAAFGRAQQLDPEILRRRHQQAIELEQNGEFHRAEQLFREILMATPDHTPTLFNLGWLLLTAGRPAEAIEPLTRGLEIRDDERARQMLAQARRQSRR